MRDVGVKRFEAQRRGVPLVVEFRDHVVAPAQPAAEAEDEAGALDKEVERRAEKLLQERLDLDLRSAG